MYLFHSHISFPFFHTPVSPSKESEIIVQALRLNTLSKLTFADCRHFDQLVRDIFPDVEFKDLSQEELVKALEQSAQEMHLEIIRSQVSHMTINTVHVLLFLSHDNQYMPFTSLLSLLSLSPDW